MEREEQPQERAAAMARRRLVFMIFGVGVDECT